MLTVLPNKTYYPCCHTVTPRRFTYEIVLSVAFSKIFLKASCAPTLEAFLFAAFKVELELLRDAHPR